VARTRKIADVGLMDNLTQEEATALALYLKHKHSIEGTSATDDLRNIGKKMVIATVSSWSVAERMTLICKGFIDGRFRAAVFE